MSGGQVPYIPASRDLPELTVRGVVLGVILSVILGAANAYLGLRVGLTVSASIPAAVMSMAVLRALRNHSILENNAVQTAASAGESLAAGVIFTVPALVILGTWSEVDYLQTTLLALSGGVLGVLFTVPLRRALIVESELVFPEGVATAEVLKAGEPAPRRRKGSGAVVGGTGIVGLIVGILVGAVYKFLESAGSMWSATALVGRRFRDSGVVAFGSDLSPALVAVGYIVGIRIAVLVFAGGVMGWIVAIPLYSMYAGDAAGLTAGLDFEAASFTLWSQRIRYMGVGAMLVGGVWSLIQLRRPLGQALRQGLLGPVQGDRAVPRTEQEFGIRATFLAVIGMAVPIALLYWYSSGSAVVAIVMSLLMVLAGFLFSAVAGYMAGLVGSSNNPISGVTILTVLTSALTLRYVLGVDVDSGPPTTILVATIIAAAGAIAGDNMQDLKAGHILGATPRRQQVMQIVGVAALALVIAPVLNVLHRAYTFGSAELAAPQAGLMAAVAQFIFEGGLPRDMLAIGAGIASGLIVLDAVLARAGSTFRTPVMPVAVGIYLPVGLSTPIFIGGLVAWGAARLHRARSPRDAKKVAARKAAGSRAGTLLASGLIAGEAIIGILIAALVVIDQPAPGSGRETTRGIMDALSVSDGSLVWPGLLLFGFVVFLVWYVAARPALLRDKA